LLQAALVMAGTRTNWQVFGDDPLDDKVPHPLVKHRSSEEETPR